MSVDPFALIEEGLQIFPTDPGDKRPVAADKRNHPVNPKWDYQVPRLAWSKEASNDPAQIAQWQAEYPGCNWGVPMGHVNGLIAVDIDSQAARDWWDEKWMPEGVEINTPGGGWHLIYSIDGMDVDIQTNKSKVYDRIDIRGEGGYVVAYATGYSSAPEIPESVLDILPERQEYTSEPMPEVEPATDMTEQEKRVLKAITDRLDALPRPWHEGAGYHNTSFEAACWLNRIANSPYYATTREQAKALYIKHAPLRDKADASLRDHRWLSASETTAGQMAEPPGDTPVRLEVTDELLSRFSDSEIDGYYWDSKSIGQVKKLIHALRLKGANEQEAYSISYDCAAMKAIRKANPKSSSTWGYVSKEYAQPIAEDDEIEEAWGEPAKAPVKASGGSVPIKILTDEERASIRNYPNFIDFYIDAAKMLYTSPNLPLHYVNAWIALSVGIGDKGAIYEKKGRTPLSLWGFNAAPTAAGKSDANNMMHNVVDVIRSGGFAGVNLGDDASAQMLVETVMDRGLKTTGLFIDECRTFLAESKKPGSYHYQTMNACLKLYDGKASRALRKGMDTEQAGETTDASFTLWLQGPWDQIVEIMDESDIQTGMVGRFLVALGNGAQITRESLTPEIASEFQVSQNGGRHPIIDSFTTSVAKFTGGSPFGQRMDFASQDVVRRFVDMREAVIASLEGNPRQEYLRGIFLRVTFNMLKGAALLALSEGRLLIEMEDLLIAMKSGEYWLQGSLEMVDGISGSQYRRLVNSVVQMVEDRPRSTASLLRSPSLSNMKKYEAMEILERAEAEGRIKTVDGRWEIVEKKTGQAA